MPYTTFFMVGTFIGYGVLQLLGGPTSPNVPVWALITLITDGQTISREGVGEGCASMDFGPV